MKPSKLGRPRKNCEYCHGAMSHRLGAMPIKELCPTTRKAANARSREYYRSGRHAERYADKLALGERIQSVSHHHAGMAALKARLGDPRPEGMTLSLVNWDSPDAYWGYYFYKKGDRRQYRLSTNPDDYAWETMSTNHLRKQVAHAGV